MDSNINGSQNPSIETTIKSFEGKLPQLDALAGQQQTPETPQAPEVPETPEEKPKGGIRKMVDEETPEQPEAEQPESAPEVETPEAATPEAQPESVAGTTQEEDDEISLEELMIDYGGQERSVSEVLSELSAAQTEAQAAKDRIAEIEKDPFLKDFIAHYLANGDAGAYLEARAVDYDKKSDLEILKMKFDKDNADFPEQTRELLWRRELRDKYKVSAELSDEEKESDEYQIAQALLQRDAKNARVGFKDQQSKFQIAERKVEEKEQAPAQPQYDPVAAKQELLKVKEVDAFMKNKLLKLGVTDDKGNSFAIEHDNPDAIVEMMMDDRKFWNQFAKSGKVDHSRLMKTYAYSLDPEGYEKQLVEFGKDLALEERLKESKNTDGRLNKQSTPAQTTEQSQSRAILEAMMKAKQR